MARWLPGLAAVAAGAVLVVVAWPRFIGGAVIAPHEALLRDIARGAKPAAASLREARESARISLDWFDYSRTRMRLGAFELVTADLETAPDLRRGALDRSIAALDAGLARSPGDAYGWLQLAQAMRQRNGATAALNPPLRMSLRTARYEHRLIIPRLELAFSAWNVLEPDVREALGPQIVRAVDIAPVKLARATRRFFVLRQVRQVLAASPVHLERFDIVYLTPD